MLTTNEYRAAAEWLRSCRRPLLVTHRKADGDALGSLAALARVLTQWGQTPTVALFDAFPPRYEHLRGAATWQAWSADFAARVGLRESSGGGTGVPPVTRTGGTPEPPDQATGTGETPVPPTSATASTIADALVILDTCSNSQLEPIAAYLPAAPRTLVFDHHATRDDIGTRPGDLRLIDPSAAATCLMLAEWLSVIGGPADSASSPRLGPSIARSLDPSTPHLDPLIPRPLDPAPSSRLDAVTATALFTGLATDTGWFRFSNADARALLAAAVLLEAGARSDTIYRAVHEQEPAGRLRLLGRLLSSLEVRAGGRLAVVKLQPEDFAAAGASPDMTEDLINEPGKLAGVECVVLFSSSSGERRSDGAAERRSDGATERRREQPKHGGETAPWSSGADAGGHSQAVRINFRSKERVDVSALAAQFGGGGHARAAGARVVGAWDEVVARVVAAAEAALAE